MYSPLVLFLWGKMQFSATTLASLYYMPLSSPGWEKGLLLD